MGDGSAPFTTRTFLTSFRSSRNRLAQAVHMRSRSGFDGRMAPIAGSKTRAFRFAMQVARSFAGVCC